ncbi:heat shock protein beta-1-like [Oppia nitens]|uniref:heat shock protein beta-1-like n=1 Tax=Oppia nitens TaxID=1686743 RepID=UPI0023D9D20F|nr:heat shock protein beta-1-like [Oppia nitens]
MALNLFLPYRSSVFRRNQHLFDWPQSLFDLDLNELDDHWNRSMSQLNQISGSSQVANTGDKFSVKLDVSHFKPEEIEVKTIGNSIQIHGKHEERSDSHGWIAREFTRRYALPDGCKAEEVMSSLKPNGVLTIEAKKEQLPPISGVERVVPIAITEGDKQ